MAFTRAKNPPPSPHSKPAPRPAICNVARPSPSEDPDPAPWLARKVAVGIVAGVFAYSYYVVLATLIVPSLHQATSPTWATRPEAIAFLVVFNLLWLMFIWVRFPLFFTPLALP